MIGHTFQAKLLSLLIAVLMLLQTATLIAVHFAGQQTLRRSLAEELRVGSRVFDRILASRGRQLADTVRVLASDFAFREAIASGDRPTITSVLANHGSRISADAVFLISPDGVVVADTRGDRRSGNPFPFPSLFAEGQARGEASAIVSFEGRPYQLVIVPVLAPRPIAWVCMGFTIDQKLLEDVRRLTSLDVSLWTTGADGQPVVISTLPTAKREALITQWLSRRPRATEIDEAVELGPDAYETLAVPIQTADRSNIYTLLQRNIAEANQPYQRLELQIFALSSLALVVAIIAAIFFARGVSRPLHRLANGAEKIERGDYSTAVEVAQSDEIGRLATAFNKMQTAIGEREDQIRFQATHDSLTGLPNRTIFVDRLAQAIATAKRTGDLVGMIMMDLDRFKDINDTLGHQFGDDLLNEIAHRLKQTLRESDTVARLGGDEFAVMFQAKDASRALEVAAKISGALETAFILGDVSMEVAASMGIATYPLHAEDAGTLMKRADVAMYEAKRTHVSVTVYEPGRDQHSLRRLAIVSDLRHAIARGEFDIHYQPKIDLELGRAVHVEALIRWQHPVHGRIGPDEFISLAEQSGQINLITKWVLRKAIEQCAAWNAEGLELTIAVNLSAIDLYDAELPTFISGLLSDSGLSPSRLVLELTESAVMKDPAYALRILGELKRRGIALAIDDYGTGYSSLAHLKRLPVDELKIDKSFVLNLGVASPDDLVIVRSTIELGHNMGLKVVAEGVENIEALETLKRMRCDMAQGYFLSRPLAGADFRNWMLESPWGVKRVLSTEY